jgi:ketosteroid isomerase-like protein
MMMKICYSILLLLLTAVSAGPVAAQVRAREGLSGASVYELPLAPPGDEADMASLRPVIEEHNRKMVEAFKRGDHLAVSSFYADDATIFSYRGEKVRGRAAIDKYWTSIKGGKDWKLEVIELGGDRETVYQIGRSTLTTEREGKQSTYACDFVVIWKRQPDGTYKIHVDIYN